MAQQGPRERREVDCRRPPLHAHRGDGRHLLPHPPGHRHRLLRRPLQLHHRERPVAARVRAELHQRELPARPRLRVRPGDRPVLGLGRGDRHLQRRLVALPGRGGGRVGHLRGRRLRLGSRRRRARVHPAREGGPQARRDARGPDVRVAAVQAALLPLRHGHRVLHLRHGQGDPGARLLHLRLHRRARQSRRHPVRPGPDPAHLRRPEHPRDERAAASARQRRHRGRRRGGPARRAQRPGRHGHGHARQRAPRLPQVAQHHRPQEPARLARGRDLLRRLLHQQAQVHGLLPQGVVRRQRHRRQRLRATTGCPRFPPRWARRTTPTSRRSSS